MEWIKCVDRLPENEQEVLITIKENTLCRGGYCSRCVVDAVFYNDPTALGTWYPCFSVWGDDSGNYLTGEVEAWMPLPEPYEVEA